jgi:hypothetical protein
MKLNKSYFKPMKIRERIALILFAIGIKPRVIESGGCKLGGGYLYYETKNGEVVSGKFLFPIASRGILYALNGGCLYEV